MSRRRSVSRREASELSYRRGLAVRAVFVLPPDNAYPICPRCQNTLEWEYQDFCDRCGQRLDWSRFVPAAVNMLDEAGD